MRKKLIYLVLLGTTTYQGACQASSAVQYLAETGQNRPVGLEACKPLCVPNCQSDMANHSYGCMFGCSDLRDKKIAVCVNSQFSHYVQWRDAQLNALNQQNNAQGQQLNDLVAQMADAKDKIVRQKMKLGGKKAENADLQNRFNALEIKFSAEQQRLAGLVSKNQQLHDRLADANANINQKAADIAGLNAEIVANEREIVGLKGEIDEGVEALEELIRQFNMFVKGVGDITGMFREHGMGIRQANLQLKEQIKAMEKFIREHDEELIPFIQQKEDEFNEMIQGVQEDLNILQEFINSAKAEVSNAKRVLEETSRGMERVR